MFTTQITPTPCGPIIAPNSVLAFDVFYLSYNDHDTGIYGAATTALVLGQMQLFLILNGDHRDGFAQAQRDGGLQGCIDYFIDHIQQANDRSEHIHAYSGRDLLGAANLQRIAAAVAPSH